MSKGGGGGYEPPPITESEKVEASISAKKWNDFIDRYMPVEDALRGRVEQMDTENARRLSVNPYISQGMIKGSELAQANALKQAMGVTGNQNYMGELAAPLAEGTSSGLLGAKQNYYTQAKALADLGSDISNDSMGQFGSLAKGARDEANRLYADNVANDIARSNAQTSSLTSVIDAGTAYGMQKYVRPKLQQEYMSQLGSQTTPKTYANYGAPYRR